jgi:hypothetical protein
MGIQIGGLQAHAAIVVPGETDVLEHGQRRASADDFTETRQGGFEVADGQCDFVHDLFLWLLVEMKPPATVTR